MSKDSYSATWVSHSSISDFLACPRSYYLKNVYKNPKTGRKIQIITPPLALGQAVHEALESLSFLKTEDRFKHFLLERFSQAWEKVSGKKGGFLSPDVEQRYKERGQKMLRNIMDNPGPLQNKAIKISQEPLPHFWLSEVEEIILCGKIDWLEYLPEQDGVHIIDFKTGSGEEAEDSLQLPIYHLLVHNCQHRKVVKASYWYLEKDNGLEEKSLPDLAESERKVLDIARKIKLARRLEKFDCPQGGCRVCLPYEKVLRSEAELVGQGGYDRDIYILPNEADNKESEIL